MHDGDEGDDDVDEDDVHDDNDDEDDGVCSDVAIFSARQSKAKANKRDNAGNAFDCDLLDARFTHRE